MSKPGGSEAGRGRMLSPGQSWERGLVSRAEWWLKGVNMFGLSRTKQLNQYWKYITGPGFYRQSVGAAPVTIRYLGWTVRRAHKTSFMLFKSNKNKHNLMKLPGLDVQGDVFYLQQGEGRYYNSISYWKLYSLAKESRKLKIEKYFLFIFRIFVFSIII